MAVLVGRRFGCRRPVVHAGTFESGVSGNFELPHSHTACDHEGAAFQLGLVGEDDRLDRVTDPDVRDFGRRDQLRSEAGCLGNRSPCQVGATDTLRKAEVVLDARTRPGLAARCFSLEQHGRQAFGGAVHRGGESGGPAADDGEIVERRLRR